MQTGSVWFVIHSRVWKTAKSATSIGPVKGGKGVGTGWTFSTPCERPRRKLAIEYTDAEADPGRGGGVSRYNFVNLSTFCAKSIKSAVITRVAKSNREAGKRRMLDVIFPNVPVT